MRQDCNLHCIGRTKILHGSAQVANKRNLTNYFVSPATGSTPLNLMRLHFQHFFHRIPFKYWLKLPITAFVAFLFAPFNLYERIALRKKIRDIQLDEAPVFILGHWRSGTTHLHNLLHQDPDFGCTSTMHCLFPHSFLTNPLVKLFLKLFMPSTRPMDNVAINMASPQEDELGTANVTPYSFYNTWMFPRSVWRDYKRYVRFEGVSDRQKERWKRKYLYLLKKAALNSGANRLVLKNPAHTARIPLLLELFPKAKFIFLYRNPVTVFYSTRRLYTDALPQFAMQTLPQAQADKEIFRIYEDLMAAYLEARDMIPSENLMELRFEDLEADRMGKLKEIYRRFDLPGWEKAEAAVSAYLGDIKSYKKNVHTYSDAEIRLVQEKWGFAFKELGYEVELAS